MSPLIVAVASPPGRSARGIVRLSGTGTLELIEAHAGAAAQRGAQLARLRVDGLDLPCTALVFPGPRSYTGEDAAELQVPGNPVLLQRVVEGLFAGAAARGLDARRAEAGEFTARAFLNGRMTLTQAEGVAAIIAAESDAQLRAGRLLAEGALGAIAEALSDALADALARVEAGIDFTDEEDVVAVAPEELAGRLDGIRGRLESVLERAVGSEQLEAIPRVVLAGDPNAGKSTLFNALLGRRRAVVSDVAGTTRDVLTETLTIDTPHGPGEVMLVDVAGAAGAGSPLEARAQAAARAAADRAELVLRCVPAAPGVPEPPRAPRELVVRTKSDLHAARGLAVCALTGAGLDALRGAIAERLADRAVSLAAETLALRPRHEAALRSALHGVGDAAGLVERARAGRRLPEPELVAAALRAALDELGALCGAVTADDVLGRVFATFCIGK